MSTQNIKQLKNEIRIPKVMGKVLFNSNMSSLTWLKAGGKAKIFYSPLDVSDLQNFLTKLDNKIPIYILGGGSNTLFRDLGYDGIVIKLNKKFDYHNISNKKKIKVGAATNCIKLARILANNGIGGLEFFSGIPGTVGGAIKMNAGAYGRETSSFLEEIKVINRTGEIKNIIAKEYEMGYRETNFPKDYIFLEATFLCKESDVKENLNIIKKLNKKRKLTQPITEKTSGSSFKNPKKFKAWKLIEESGCRSYKEGDACVSDMHANFIVNKGSATSSNIENLGESIKEKVLENFGIKLIWEIQIIGNKDISLRGKNV